MPPVTWIVRPVVWFIVGSIAITVVHELAHVSTAFALGVRSTLYNYSGDLDMTPAQAASHLPALIRVAGPLVSLFAGLGAWFAMKRARGSAAELPLVFQTVFGAGTFFGNLMSTSFVGDFSSVAVWLELPMGLRYAVSVAGGVCLVGVHFWAGRELVRWVPAHLGRLAGVLGIVAVPVVLGTAVVVLVSLPMANTTVSARIGEASFWLFAALAALLQRRNVPRFEGRLTPQWSDGVAVLLALIIVRVLVRGILFDPA
jgi:hypothetical protein